MKKYFLLIGLFVSLFAGAQVKVPVKAGVTVDATLTDGSSNPPTNNAVFDGLASKQRLMWYNVLDYGADSTGATDNSTEFTAAIAAMPTYGGTLFVPKGRYKFTSGFTVNKQIKIIGEGAGVHVGFESISQLFTETDGITLITVTRAGFHMEGIGLEFRSLTTSVITGATSGRGMHFTNADDGFRKSFRLKDCSFRDFYDNIDIEEGANWHITSCYFVSAERYNLRIRNVSEPDGGDWTIDGQTQFYQYGADTGGIGIYQESSGGGKISNVKMNGSFTYGYYGAFPSGAAVTSILQIANTSFENFTSAGVYVQNYEYVLVTGCEFGPYTSISDAMISLVSVEGATLTGNVFVGNTASSNVAIITDADCDKISVCGNVYTDFTDPTPITLAGTNVSECGGGSSTDYLSLPVYEDSDEAEADGLDAGDLYRTSTGAIMMRLPDPGVAFSIQSYFNGVADALPTADEGAFSATTNFEVDGTGGLRSMDGTFASLSWIGAGEQTTRVKIKTLDAGDLSFLIIHRFADGDNRITYNITRTSGTWTTSCYKRVGGVETALISGVVVGISNGDTWLCTTSDTHVLSEIVGAGQTPAAHGVGGILTSTNTTFADTGSDTIFDEISDTID